MVEVTQENPDQRHPMPMVEELERELREFREVPL